MKAVWAVVAGVVGVVLLVVVGSYWSNANYGNMAENQIKFGYANLENVLAQGGLKVKEVAQVPGMKVDDLARISKEAMTDRYGAGGSKAVVQWIQENYPGQVSDDLYKQIQQVIESYRDKFQNEQSKFLDIKNTYANNLGNVWTGFWLARAGYPKIDLAKYEIISTDAARETFRTHTDKPIELRPR